MAPDRGIARRYAFAMQKMSKADSKLVSRGRSEAGRAIREKTRGRRMIGIPLAIMVARAEGAAPPGMIPSITLPALGATKITTMGGWLAVGAYMFSKNPSAFIEVTGLTGLGLVCRAQ